MTGISIIMLPISALRKQKAQFRNYLQLKESYNQQQNKLENMRTQYSRANQNERSKMAPAILDLEKRVLQLANEVDRTAIQVRN